MTAASSGIEYHAALVAALPDAVLVVDAHGRCIDGNPAATALLGYTLEELRHLTPSDVIISEPGWLTTEARRFAATGRWRGDLKLRRKDGTAVPVSARAMAVPGPTGPTYAAIFRDAAARHLDEVGRALSVASPVGIFLANEAGHCTYTDARCQAIGGFGPEEALGDGWTAFVHPDDRAALLAGWQAAAAAGNGFEGECRFRHRDGTDRWTHIRSVPVRSDCGDVVSHVAMLQDISEQQRAESDLRERTRQAELVGAVGAVMAGSAALPEQLQQSAEAVQRWLDAALVRIWTLDPGAAELVLRASAGRYLHLDGAHARIPIGALKIGHIAAERRPHLTNDVPNDPLISDQAWARREGMVAFAGYPLLADERVVGVVALFATRPLGDETLRGLASVADILATGIERRRAEERLREERDALAIVNRIGRVLAAELDLEQLLQAVVDASVALTGATFGAFFYNTVNESGETYALYTLSGAPREAFSRYPLPRATDLFGPTFRGDDPIRIHDVRADPRYGRHGPYHGMPEGHLPVVSYLAVPVVSRSGEVLGGLFFGHPAPGIFDQRAEDLAVGLAAYAAVALDNARLFASLRAEENRLRATFDGASAGMALVGLDGRWLRVNRALCEMLAYPEAELLRLTFADVTHPDDRAASEALVPRLIEGGPDSSQLEKRYRRKDGATVWGLLTIALVRDEAGTPLHFVSQIQDVTARKEAEAERERLAAIVESAEDAIIGRDLNGIITSWNHGAQRLFGYTAAEVIGQSVAILAPGELAGEIPMFLERIRRGERIEGHETVRTTRDGRRLHVSVTISPVHDNQGHIAGASVIARDISARKRLEELRRDYLAMVTHDLRTPLTSVRGFAQLLQRRGVYHQGTVEAVLAETDRMRRLIDDLADLVRLEAGKLELRCAPVDLADLARREVTSIQAQTERHAIRVVAPDEPVRGEWDAGRIGQVLQNLLTNAVKYSPAGGTVTVTAATSGMEAHLAVHDEGPGIAEEHLPLLFERFYRSGTTGAGGLGLGLYIARMLVEAHGGRITAASTPGRGSTFTVTLPMR